MNCTTCSACVIAFLALCLPSLVQSQDRAAIEADFQVWLEDGIWPKASSAGVSRSTFDAALSNVDLNWDLPDLIIPGNPDLERQSQAEFRAPASYFAPGGLTGAVEIGRQMAARHATPLAQIEQQTGVPGHIILSIWGRESSYGRAAVPHDAFEILGTKGFMSKRAAYFTEELIFALRMLEEDLATRDQMRSSWAGALGQPQFMPSSYFAYATDGDGDGRADIWQSEPDTLWSIASYLKQFGWNAGRDWGFEVVVPPAVSCASEGPDNGRPIQQWLALDIARVSGRPFPNPEIDEVGYLLMPAGRNGPAFIVTSNFYVLKDYNESDVYALFVGHVADRIKFGVGGFARDWAPQSELSRVRIEAMQRRLEELGYDVGGADGLIGNKTRRSIGQWQEQNGRKATCYPDPDLISDILR